MNSQATLKSVITTTDQNQTVNMSSTRTIYTPHEQSAVDPNQIRKTGYPSKTSNPPFAPIKPQLDTPSTSNQYDPEVNWKINRKRCPSQTLKSNHAEKIRKLANIDELLSEEDRKIKHYCLTVQRSRELDLNPENRRFLNHPKYTLKANYNKFTTLERVKVRNDATNEDCFMKSDYLPLVKHFSLSSKSNRWRIKNSDPQTKTYNVRNHQLDVYINIPYDAITAFPSAEDLCSETSKESLITENNRFKQELFIKETELQELQIKFENLKMESNEKEKTTSDDYWRRQYVITKQLQKTEDSNLKQMNKVYAQKHLEIASANQKLGIENKKLVQKVKELNRELRKMKDKKTRKNKREERRQPEATRKTNKKPVEMVASSPVELTIQTEEVVEVFDILDDGDSPVTSPVILPPEFFN